MSKRVSSGPRSHTSRQVSHGYQNAPPTAHVYPKLPCQISTFRVKAAIAIVRDLRRHAPNNTSIAWTPANRRLSGRGWACDANQDGCHMNTWECHQNGDRPVSLHAQAGRWQRHNRCHINTREPPPNGGGLACNVNENRCHMDA